MILITDPISQEELSKLTALLYSKVNCSKKVKEFIGSDDLWINIISIKDLEPESDNLADVQVKLSIDKDTPKKVFSVLIKIIELLMPSE